LGIGNPYMHDDAIGIEVVAELRKRELDEKILVFEYRTLDLSLLTYFKNSSKIVLVDALKSGQVPGTVSKYSVSDSKNPMSTLPNLHGLQLYDVVDLASQTGVLSCPIVVVGIEPKDCTPGEGLSDEVKGALPKVINVVMNELLNQPGA
jgi:hydrogenase maturation protease